MRADGWSASDMLERELQGVTLGVVDPRSCWSKLGVGRSYVGLVTIGYYHLLPVTNRLLLVTDRLLKVAGG